MPLYLGQLMVTSIRKEQRCDGCNTKIEPKSFIPQLKYKTKAGSRLPFYTKRYHSWECLTNFGEAKIEDYKEIYSTRIGGRPFGSGHLSQLTPEQKTRRERILYYISTRFRPALLKAYSQKSTKRVNTVYALYHKYFTELESFGVKYPLHISSDKYEDLTRMIYTYDFDFAHKFGQDSLTNKEKIDMLIRTTEPQWDKELFTGRIRNSKQLREEARIDKLERKNASKMKLDSNEDKEIENEQ